MRTGSLFQKYIFYYKRTCYGYLLVYVPIERIVLRRFINHKCQGRPITRFAFHLAMYFVVIKAMYTCGLSLLSGVHDQLCKCHLL